MRPLTDQLLKQQLNLLRRVALSPADSPMRANTFAEGSLIPQIGCYVRRVGRPRQEWTSQLLREGAGRIGYAQFYSLLQDSSVAAQKQWNVEVEKLFEVRP